MINLNIPFTVANKRHRMLMNPHNRHGRLILCIREKRARVRGGKFGPTYPADK